MFQKIDWFLLSHFEKGCHALQRLTGKTNYYFWGLCNFLITLIMVMVFFNTLPPRSTMLTVTAQQFSTVFWIFLTIFAIRALSWHTLELAAYDRLNNKLSNPEKISASAMFSRMICIIYLFLPFTHVGIYDKAFFALGGLSVFLGACDPLPPCKGKVKEWLKSFGKKPAFAATKAEE